MPRDSRSGGKQGGARGSNNAAGDSDRDAEEDEERRRHFSLFPHPQAMHTADGIAMVQGVSIGDENAEDTQQAVREILLAYSIARRRRAASGGSSPAPAFEKWIGYNLDHLGFLDGMPLQVARESREGNLVDLRHVGSPDMVRERHAGMGQPFPRCVDNDARWIRAWHPPLALQPEKIAAKTRHAVVSGPFRELVAHNMAIEEHPRNRLIMGTAENRAQYAVVCWSEAIRTVQPLLTQCYFCGIPTDCWCDGTPEYYCGKALCRTCDRCFRSCPYCVLRNGVPRNPIDPTRVEPFPEEVALARGWLQWG